MKTVDFEDMLAAVGNYGKFQKRLVIGFLIPISVTIPFLCMNLIFMLVTPEHRCSNPALAQVDFLTPSEKVALTQPWTKDAAGHPELDSCHIFSVNYTEVVSNASSLALNISDYAALFNSTWNTQSCQHGWDYDRSEFRSTVNTQWDLVCSDDHLPSLVYTMSSVGSAFGTPVLGIISDKFGRKITFFVSSVIAVITAVATVAVPTFAAFVVIRTINGILMPSVFQLPYLILVEIVSPDMRTAMNGISCVTWTVSLALMPLVAWLTADWVIFGWICAAASFPYVAYYWVLPESPRWLISQDRYDDAKEVLENVAKVNGKDVSNIDFISLFKKYNAQEREQREGTQVSPLELFRNPTICLRFFLITMGWIADSVAYDGFHINVSSLYGNQFLNFFLLALVEFPSYLITWYLMETKLGRRWTNVFFLFLSSFACILPIMAEIPTLTTVASLVGKFGVSASFMVMYQQSAEIFPTPLRAFGMGISATIASLVAISVPYIIYLGMYGRHIPFTCMSLLCLAGGVAALFIPETLNENLPQTVQDGENFGKGRPFFCFADTNKPEPNQNLEELSMENLAGKNTSSTRPEV